MDSTKLEEYVSSATEKLSQAYETGALYINYGVDNVAHILSEKLLEYDLPPWLAGWVRPLPPPPPPPSAVIESMSLSERLQDWASRNKLMIAAASIATGYVGYKVYRKNMLRGKTRRAKRAETGGRCDVVIIAGSPTLPLTRCLSLDLERKGFIIFIVCNTIEEEMIVQNLSRPDVRPLSIDVKDPARGNSSIARFAHFMQKPHAAVPKAKPTYLNLRSVFLVPSLNYQTSPIATIPPSCFSDLFNTHLLHPILTIQAFLPLLTAQLNPYSRTHRPKVLVFTPSIISSINPPFHAPESTICSALGAFTEVLAAELRPLKIPVTYLQLGTFDFSGFSTAMARQRVQSTGSTGFHPHTSTSLSNALPPPADMAALPWPDLAKVAYGANFVATTASSITAGRIKGMRGSSLRDLHNAVFDILDGSETSAVVRIGLGAELYGFVGRWAPRSLVSWMIGVRQVEEMASWRFPKEDGSDEEDNEVESDDEEDEGPTAGSTFIDVDEHSNVWREGST